MLVVCACYAGLMRLLCVYYASTMRLLCACYAGGMRLLCVRYASAMRPLCGCYAAAMPVYARLVYAWWSAPSGYYPPPLVKRCTMVLIKEVNMQHLTSGAGPS